MTQFSTSIEIITNENWKLYVIPGNLLIVALVKENTVHFLELNSVKTEVLSIRAKSCALENIS